MDSRPLLKDTEKIGVLIDSKTFDTLLKQEDRTAAAILSHRYYSHSEDGLLDFVRTPMTTEIDALKEVVEYQLEKNQSEISLIKIIKNDQYVQYNPQSSFPYKMKDIIAVAKQACNKDPDKEELDKVITVFIQAVFK